MPDMFAPITGTEISQIVPASNDTHWVYFRNGTTMLWHPKTGAIQHIGKMPTFDKINRESAKYPAPAP